jgi:hypothetical protein
MTIEETKEIRRTCDGWIAAITIFKKYENAFHVEPGHDILWAGPDPAKVSDEDKEVLEALGWHPSDDSDCFAKYT